MKRWIVLLFFLAALTACQKDSRPLTMDAAIKKVEKIIKQYPNRGWYASKNTLEPRAILQYSQFGNHWDFPEAIHEFTAPDYRAWLVMLAEDFSGTTPNFDCLHLFINVETGKVEQVWLKGQAIVEWGSTPSSRAMQSNSGK